MRSQRIQPGFASYIYLQTQVDIFPTRGTTNIYFDLLYFQNQLSCINETGNSKISINVLITVFVHTFCVCSKQENFSTVHMIQ